MGKLMKAKECERQIAELDHRQKTEKLTAIQERAILKDLKDLQNSLPLIQEVDTIEDEIKVVQDSKKVLGRKLKVKIDERNKVKERIDEIKAKQKEAEGENNAKSHLNIKEDKPKHPLTIKIDDIKKNMDEIRAKKQTLKDDHDARYKAWRDQNELDAKIKWIKRQQANLRRIKEQEEWDAAQKARR